MPPTSVSQSRLVPRDVVWLQPPVSQALALLVLRGLERSAAPMPARVLAAVRLTRLAFQHRDGSRSRTRRSGNRSSSEAQTGGARASAPRQQSGCGLERLRRSLLVSVFDGFGSAVLVPEGEFLLNDRLRGFSPNPGSPNTARAGARPVRTSRPRWSISAARVSRLRRPERTAGAVRGTDPQPRSATGLDRRALADAGGSSETRCSSSAACRKRR
jgi:gamma-glutamyltranspeptidase/glutathione hydrolase